MAARNPLPELPNSAQETATFGRLSAVFDQVVFSAGKMRRPGAIGVSAER
ncbi:MAG: hypothetical protein KGK16_08535 [Bradyrhizobium sp.]|nr:hypothetical protein [Bradyrhizobium sp.]